MTRVARYRTACLAHHWDFLLQPLMLEYPGQTGRLRYRLLEYNRMPFMSFIAVDDPTELTRADFVRIGMVTRSGEADTLPYSSATLADFERDYCDDRFWGRSGERFSGDTRIIVTGHTFSIVGRHDDYFFSGSATGLLGQFRHQYFLLFLIAHFHKAALVSMSDELAVAMNRLTVGETESVKQFKRTIRQMMEVFLRFTILGLIGTIASGLLGMNIIDEAARPAGIRMVIFLIFLAGTVALTVVTVAHSKRLADVIDALSDSRLNWGSKWQAMRRAWSSAP